MDYPGPSREQPIEEESDTEETSLHHPTRRRHRGMETTMTARVTLFLLLIAVANGISIDNDIVDEPDIECLEDSIRIWVKTRKLFAGRIYAKGRADIEECYKDDFAHERTKKPRFDLKFGLCGMKSLRSVDPRGMYYGITIVVSFHPLFITKVDQAFHVKCFFEEANRGLTAELGVRSSIDDLDAGRPAGPAIQFARVGDKVLHQWHCNDQMFGVLIRNCYVTDGFGKRSDVIDDQGCPIDPVLITGIRYSADLQRGYAESQVFKFADKPGVWFFCQIQMCMKGHGMCENVTPPSCASTAPPASDNSRGIDYDNGDRGFGARRDGKNGNRSGGKPRRPPPPPASSSDYEDNTDNDSDFDSDYNNFPLKHRNPTPDPPFNANPYGRPPSNTAFDESVDTATEETATVFGPGLSSDDFGLPTRVTTATEKVSQEFETEDDLHLAKEPPTPPPSKISNLGKNSDKEDDDRGPNEKASSGDYNDYADVTIPPNLTDLLANLPDDVSAEGIQKMFRDSVDDRRALLQSMDKLKNQLKIADKKTTKTRQGQTRFTRDQGMKKGDKIGSMTVDWKNTRRRDDPITEDSEVPMIAGQLLIYDLDEEPPREKKDTNIIDSDVVESESVECAISRTGLLFLSGSLSAVAAALFVVTLCLYLKLHRLHSPHKKPPPLPPSDHLFPSLPRFNTRFHKSS